MLKMKLLNQGCILIALCSVDHLVLKRGCESIYFLSFDVWLLDTILVSDNRDDFNCHLGSMEGSVGPQETFCSGYNTLTKAVYNVQ